MAEGQQLASGHACHRRVPEDRRPQRHRVELLDGSAGPAGRCEGECATGEERKWSRCRCGAGGALAAYKDFLTLWKDADPEIPIYQQAKAEYAKLQ